MLLPPGHDGAGRRVYRHDDVHRIEVLLHLRDTGMPLAQIAEFTRLVASDPEGVPERLELLHKHRAHVILTREQLIQALTVTATDTPTERHHTAPSVPVEDPLVTKPSRLMVTMGELNVG